MSIKTGIGKVASRLAWSRGRGKNWVQRTLYCSFCGKSQHDVEKLIAGPSVFICDECVKICNDVIAQEEARVAKDRSVGDAPVEPAGREPHRIGAIESMPTERLLLSLQSQEALFEQVRAAMQESVDTLRRREVSWATIGEALGVSRQAAWDRFS